MIATDPMYRAELMTTGGVSREETTAGAAVEAASFVYPTPMPELRYDIIGKYNIICFVSNILTN
jgi:hypothetical protein